MTESIALPLGAVAIGGFAFTAAVAAGLRRHRIALVFAATVAALLIGFLI